MRIYTLPHRSLDLPIFFDFTLNVSPLSFIIAPRLRGGRRSARSGGKPRFGTPIDRGRRKKAVGMRCLEIVDDRSEPRRLEVTGDPVLSPSIDGGIRSGRMDLYDFIDRKLL